MVVGANESAAVVPPMQAAAAPTPFAHVAGNTNSARGWHHLSALAFGSSLLPSAGMVVGANKSAAVMLPMQAAAAPAPCAPMTGNTNSAPAAGFGIV